MEFSELVDIPELQKLCDAYCAHTGAVIALLDLKGKILIYTGWQDICTKFHRVNSITAQRCCESDTVLAGRLGKGEKYNVYKCKNGLIDVAVPILIDGEHVANFFTGQFFFERPDQDFFIRQAEEFGFDKNAYLEALAKVPIVTEGHVKKVMSFFSLLSRLFAEMGLARKRLEGKNDELESRVEIRTQELVGANEELTAMNEEMLSMNESLQVLNQSLEGEIVERQRVEQALKESKEELMVANKELMTSNLELVKLNRELYNTQESLLRSEKMAALARLVTGMAHEINTPMGICVTLASHIADSTNRLKNTYQTGDMQRSDLEEYIIECSEATHMLLLNTDRAAKLVSNFKQVSADQTSEARRCFSVGSYIDEILTMLTAKLKKSDHVIQVECDDSIVIDGYPGAFAQILTNLILNSIIHAYDPGVVGRISIHVEKLEHRLVITYKDDGKGMDSNVLGKIFDPFFTTNRNRGGTGLGLYIVYNLVHQLYAGHIECISQPGAGATFIIIIPLTVSNVDKELDRKDVT